MESLTHGVKTATPRNSRARVCGVCLVLALVTWLVFGQTLRHGFINYDDGAYVYGNPEIVRGLSPHGLVWAFSHVHAANWHPLTSISHMLDCQLFQLKAGGHHFTNVLLHTIAAILLFLVLREMTGALWRSAFVAAIFAIHPLRVESVAWIAERKDVLSGVFFMLTLGAYVRYACKPSVARYLLMAALLACGLMSKPMLVTTPLILWLIDYWPLKRFDQLSPARPKAAHWTDRRSVPARLILEKLPLVMLAAGSSVATLLVQRQTAAPLETVPFAWRISNAIVSYVIYLWQMVWPVDLALLYPHPGKTPLWQIGTASMVLLTVSACAIVYRKRRPYLFTGWFWYLIMLVPVIGVIQVGSQGHADRYTYLPGIGLSLCVTWAVADFSLNRRYLREVVSLSAVIVMVLLAWRAWRQTSYWQSSEKLWRHTLAVAPQNDLGHFMLAQCLLENGRADEAIPQFRTVLQTHANYSPALLGLAGALIEKGQADEAIGCYSRILQTGGESSLVRLGLAKALLSQGRVEEAIANEEQAVRLDPNDAEAHGELGNALLQNGRTEEAIGHYRKMIEFQPNNPTGWYNLGVALHRQGRLSEAIVYYRQTLSIQADYPDVRENLGDALRQDGQFEEARKYLQMPAH